LCRAFPFGKISVFQKEGLPEEGLHKKMARILEEGDEYVADNREGCRHCSSICDNGPETTVGEYLDSQGATEGFDKNAIWWKILSLIAQVQLPKLRYALGGMAFDFDRILTVEKLPVDEVIARRNPSFEEHMAEVQRTVEGIISRNVDRVISDMEDFRKRLGLGMPEGVVEAVRSNYHLGDSNGRET
jgi:hypothetical protein